MENSFLAAWVRTLRRHRAGTAVIEAASGTCFTFGALDEGSDRWIATHVGKQALERQLVVFSAANGAAWLEILLGIVKAGGVAVPMDPGELPAAQRSTARKLGAAFCWTEDRLERLDRGKRAPRGVALVKLTSGSTGEPRPLYFTADQVLADARQVTSTMRISSADLNHALIPLGHSYGLGNLTVPLIAQGVPLVVGSSSLPHAIAAEFQQFHATVFPAVPTIWRSLVESGIEAVALNSLRLAISAGAPLAPSVAAGFEGRFGQRIHNFYGSSETGGIAFDRSGSATLRGGVGKAMRGVALSLSREGHLRVCSAAVTTLGNRRRDRRHGCWIMPDRVELTPNGALRVLGRRDAVVKIGGRRVALTEVETAVRALAGVGEVWLGASEGSEPLLGVAVESRRGVAELRAELGSALSSWKVPRRWLVLEALPRNARGKLDVPGIRTKVFGEK